MKLSIIPSVIANNQLELEKRIKKLPKSLVNVQLDVMDGSFVPGFSLDFDFILPKGRIYEAHLMARNPEPWFSQAHKKINSVLIHYESQAHLEEFIALAKGYKKKVGIAINPETEIENIIPYIKWVDKVLIMTVHPGKYGSDFLLETVEKVRKLRVLMPKLTIQVDGGINPQTIGHAAGAGANEFVVGSFIQNSKDISKANHELQSALKPWI